MKKSCMLGDCDPITSLCYLEQFKRSSDAYRVSERTTLWIFLHVMKNGPLVSFNSRPLPIGVSGGAYARPKKGDDKIGPYVKAVSHLLRSCVTNANIAREAPEIGQLIKLVHKFVVQFAVAIRFKAVKCGKTYSDERMKKIFIDGVSVIVCSGAWMFCGSELEARLIELAQYFSTLLDQQHGKVEKFQISAKRIHVKERSRRETFVATEGGTQESNIGHQDKSVVKSDHVPHENFETTSSGQYKHCRLCLQKDHNMDMCKFAFI